MSNATSALTATIMAHTVDCLKQDKRENARLAMLFLTKRLAYERLNEDEKEKADKEYDQLKQERSFSECVCAARALQIYLLKFQMCMLERITWHL